MHKKDPRGSIATSIHSDARVVILQWVSPALRQSSAVDSDSAQQSTGGGRTERCSRSHDRPWLPTGQRQQWYRIARELAGESIEDSETLRQAPPRDCSGRWCFTAVRRRRTGSRGRVLQPRRLRPCNRRTTTDRLRPKRSLQRQLERRAALQPAASQCGRCGNLRRTASVAGCLILRHGRFLPAYSSWFHCSGV